MRLFVGIPLEPSISDALVEIQKQTFIGPGFRIEQVEKLHITLVYIGEVLDATPYIETLKNINFKPCDILIEGVGKFINRQVVYYAKVKETEALQDLAQNTLTAIQSIDGNIRYKFAPHITLGRANKNVPFSFTRHPIAMVATKFILFESKDGKYIPLYQYGVE